MIIKALPEGSCVPVRVPMFTIYNTRPEFFWLTNYFETLLSAIIWMPCTSATIAKQYHKILIKYAEETSSNKLVWFLPDIVFYGLPCNHRLIKGDSFYEVLM